jgi:hypothetical protein
MQLKDANGSENTMNALFDWNDETYKAKPNQKAYWHKTCDLMLLSEKVGIDWDVMRAWLEDHGAKTTTGKEPKGADGKRKSVQGMYVPLCGALSSSSICLIVPPSGAEVAPEAVEAVEAVEELAPVLANGELPQETPQDASEPPESDEGLKPELVELEAGDAQRGFTEGWAKVDALHEQLRNQQWGARPPVANPVLEAATRDMEVVAAEWLFAEAESLAAEHGIRIEDVYGRGNMPLWAECRLLLEQGITPIFLYPDDGVRNAGDGKPRAKVACVPWQSKKLADAQADVDKFFAAGLAYRYVWGEGHKNYNRFKNPDGSYHNEGSFDKGRCNVAKKCGDGQFIIDVDVKGGKDGRKVLKKLEELYGKLPHDTMTVKTPSGNGEGYQLHFTLPDGVAIKSAADVFIEYGAGLDLRGEGGYGLMPPSTIDGKPYTYLVSYPPKPLPDAWVKVLVEKYGHGGKAGKSPASFLPAGTAAHSGASKPTITGQDAEDVIYALNCIDTNRLRYDDWYAVTALMHNVEGGFEAWEVWAKHGDDWDTSAAKKWNETAEMGLASGEGAGKIFSQAAYERELGKYPQAKDYVNPSTRRALERKQTNGSDAPTNGGLEGKKGEVNKTLEDASRLALGELPSVEDFQKLCVAEGAKAYAGDKKIVLNKYQFLVSGVLTGNAEVVAAHYDGKAFKWDTAVFAAAKQAAGYVLTQHQSDKRIKAWRDIDSDGQAKLLDLVEGVFKASAIAETCVNIAGLGSTDKLITKVRQGVEAWGMSGGGKSKSSGICLPEDTAAVSGADVAGVTPVFVGGGFGARPAHLGGAAVSGGGSTDYLNAAVGFADDVVAVAPPSGEEWVVKLAAHIAEMNIRHANVLMGGKNRIMRQKVGKLKEYEPRYEFIASRELEMLYEDTAIQTGWRDVRGEKKAIYRDHLNAWRKHKNCRKYMEGVKFEPHPHGTANPCSEGQFNLWAGYAVEPQAGDWSLLDRHIAEVVCEANPELYEYVMNWMAYKIQNPAKLPRAALVCRGKKGSGKGTLGHFLRKFFGEHGLHVVNGEQFIGKFNAHLAEKVFVFADEAFYSGDKKHEGVLKALITDDTMMVERKGLDAEQQNNYMALFMATNEDFAVPATEDERRYCVLDVSDKYRNVKSYFDPLYAHIEKPETVAAFLHAMLNRNVEGWNPSKIPETKGLQDQRLHSLDSVGKWLVDSIGNGSFVPSAEPHEPRGWAETERVKVLIASYVAYCKDRSVSSYDRKTDTALGLVLGKVFRKSRDTKGVTYKLGTLEQAEQAVKDFYKLGDVF